LYFVVLTWIHNEYYSTVSSLKRTESLELVRPDVAAYGRKNVKSREGKTTESNDNQDTASNTPDDDKSSFMRTTVEIIDKYCSVI